MEICEPDDNAIQTCKDTEGFTVDVMTGSYGEIAFDQELLDSKDDVPSQNKDSESSKDTEETVTTNRKQDLLTSENGRPDSLVIVKDSDVPVEKVAESAEPLKRMHKSQQTSDSQATSLDGSPSVSSEEFAICSYTHQRTGSDTSGLSDLQGTIAVDGDMVSFFAEDLQEKLKLSSPVSKWPDTSSHPGSRSSTPSLQPIHTQIPIVDNNAISDLEAHARKVASCVDTMLENLSETLQSISSRTVEYMETYESAVCRTCDSVDASIKTMYQMVAKWEELGNSVKPLYKIAEDVKNMKRLLDHFEHVVERKS